MKSSLLLEEYMRVCEEKSKEVENHQKNISSLRKSISDEETKLVGATQELNKLKEVLRIKKMQLCDD